MTITAFLVFLTIFSSLSLYHFFLIFFFRTELIRDLDCQVIFTFFDEANVADWKGRDLRQANSIPNIDLLLLTIRKVKYLLLHLFWIVLPPKKNPKKEAKMWKKCNWKFQFFILCQNTFGLKVYCT